LLFVSAIYGAAAAGQLGLALVTMAIPLALIGQTTGQAFYAEIARIGKSQPERIHRIARDVVIRLFILGLVPTLVLMFAGTWLFPLFFGANWHGAGVFASILSIYLLAQFVANPISHALNVFDKQHLYLRLNVVRAAMILGIFLIAYWMDLSAYLAIAAYSVVLSIHYVTTTITIFSVIRRKVVDRGTG
jgi:O-antigen/teichoic acid export membrane protein